MGGTQEPSAHLCIGFSKNFRIFICFYALMLYVYICILCGCFEFNFKKRWEPFRFRNTRRRQHRNAFSDTTATCGEGGYAEGKLKTGNLVAIKRLNRGPSEEITIDFLSELRIVVHVDHPNIAKLIGYIIYFLNLFYIY
ncbi:hypothetical protein ES288_D11G144700v1 [Gossypium darwinii]|uniref:Serine-threonine/tyrosine-protein kinase catalytic domain-containing protein n=1 Tax=Gossypium darwinii TaxID=34276 RepID=A0A5D2AJP8_GOSDA|nr:hypothetical protein ES288_D11G144700v1 [Gossypium darwinii]